MSKLKIPELNWISISIVFVVLSIFLTYIIVQYFVNIFPISILFALWIAVFFYISINLPDEIPKFVKRWKLLRVETKELYKKAGFLIALGIIYVLIVYWMIQEFDEVGFLVSAIPLLISWIYFFHHDFLEKKK